MENLLENLDVRICDIIDIASNTETLREFIRNTEEEYDLEPKDLEDITEEELQCYVDFLDELWNH